MLTLHPPTHTHTRDRTQWNWSTFTSCRRKFEPGKADSPPQSEEAIRQQRRRTTAAVIGRKDGKLFLGLLWRSHLIHSVELNYSLRSQQHVCVDNVVVINVQKEMDGIAWFFSEEEKCTQQLVFPFYAPEINSSNSGECACLPWNIIRNCGSSVSWERRGCWCFSRVFRCSTIKHVFSLKVSHFWTGGPSSSVWLGILMGHKLNKVNAVDGWAGVCWQTFDIK